jgi:hypothetical protein
MFDDDDDETLNDTPEVALTKGDVIDMLIKRQKLWLDASVMIANTLPDAWDVVEGYLASTYNITNLLLSELSFEPSTEVLRYSVFEQGDTVVYTIPVPLSLAVDPGQDGMRLVEYLTNLPVAPNDADTSDIPPETRYRKQLQLTLEKYPGMYMDLDRLAELEVQSAKGQLFKYPVAEKIQ